MQRQLKQSSYQYVSSGNAYYGDEAEQPSGGFWATIVEAFVDLFFDEVDDDRPVGISRLSHQTFAASPAVADYSLPPKKAAPKTGNVFADLEPANFDNNKRGQFVQSKNQFYKNANVFAQDFRYEKLAGQKPKAKPNDELYY